MKPIYFDQGEVDGCVGIFSSKAKVLPAGTAVNAMPVKYKDAAYLELEEKLGIHFIFTDNVPDVPFYAVPHIEVVAFDDQGGFAGFRNEDGTLFYIDKAWNCFRMAPNVRSLLTLADNWKESMVPVAEIHLYPSKEAAMGELEFIDIKEMMK